MIDRLVVRGAREHNLKDVSVDLPRDSLIVFTGLSGSGKSSLAFDTIFAEGQRRYVESLSAYARQFLGQMDKPDVDFIEGLSPAVSIDQKSTSRNPRSTVGTITEVYDYLRLLYARAGRAHCPMCGEPIARQTPQQIVDRIMAGERGPAPPGARAGHPRPQGRVPRAVPPAADAGLQPHRRRRRGAHARRRAAQAGQAEEAHHRRRRRPPAGQGQRQAAAHRVDRDRPRPGRWPGHHRLRRPARRRPRPHPSLLREAGLPQRPPAGRRRARAALVLVQRPVRRVRRVPRPRHPHGGRPRAGRPRRQQVPERGRHRRRGPRPTSPTTSAASSSALGDELGFSTDTPWGDLPEAASRPSCTDTPPRCTSATRTATAANARTTPRSRARSAISSAVTTRPSPTPTASGSRASCARSRARSAAAPASSRSSSRCTLNSERVRTQEHRRGLCAVDRRRRRVPRRPGDDRSRAPDRRAGAQGDQRATALPARRRPRLPGPRPRRRLAVRRRGPAHPPGHPDRRRPGRRPLRARRTLDRPAPARQPPPDRDARSVCATSATP